MMMLRSWVPLTPDPWYKFAALVFVLLLAAASAPAHDNDALGMLALASKENAARKYDDAVRHAIAAGKRLPMLADYAGYLAALADVEAGRSSDALRDLKPVWDPALASPLVSRAIPVAVRALIAEGHPDKAIKLVEEQRAHLSPAQAELLQGQGFTAAGDLLGAAIHYQRVYIEYPAAPEAVAAEAGLDKLRSLPGYPHLSEEALVARSRKLIEAGEYNRAIRTLTGVNVDSARVLTGAAYALDHDWNAALKHLRPIDSASGEVDAERLFYIAQSCFRLDRVSEARAAIEKLAAYPKSSWRLKALNAAGNYYLVTNDVSFYEPFFHACYESFPEDPLASYCHWKVTWAAYLRNRTLAAGYLQAHLQNFPESDHTTAALYFLGRVAQAQQDYPAARAYFERLHGRSPNSYYGALAAHELTSPEIGRASIGSTASAFLASLPVPATVTGVGFLPTADTQRIIERAHLLAAAGLDDFADGELRYGARTGTQPQILAMELAEESAHHDAPDQGIRIIKHFDPAYMQQTVAAAPERFWRLAFPLPYRQALERYSHEHSLDPFMVAALIRQESEFNPRAVSHSNAHGLTQVMPSTGRALSRTLHIRRFRPDMLFRPEINLQIGTYYLRSQLDQLKGHWEETLASYNAGKSRVNRWLTWGEFREPAEFVESIPFSETRNYVQSVLRNAEMYRRLYGPKAAAIASKNSR